MNYSLLLYYSYIHRTHRLQKLFVHTTSKEKKRLYSVLTNQWRDALNYIPSTFHINHSMYEFRQGRGYCAEWFITFHYYNTTSNERSQRLHACTLCGYILVERTKTYLIKLKHTAEKLCYNVGVGDIAFTYTIHRV